MNLSSKLNTHKEAVIKFITDWTSDTDYIEAHTSGSTGKPHIIRLSKTMMRDSAIRTNSFFGLSSHSHFHSCVSPEYIGGKMMIVRALELGATFECELPSRNPLDYYEPDKTIDLLAITPPQIYGLLAKINSAEKIEGGFPQISNVIIGGAPLTHGMRKELSCTDIQFWETYGMTETASHIALRRITDSDTPGFFQTLPGIAVSQDNRGCLTIKMPDETEIITNDIAEVKSETQFRIHGRFDNVIITGGKKVFPEEIENKISDLLPCRFIITSEPSDIWGEQVVLVVESANRNIIEKLNILEIISSNLSPEQRPKRIRYCNEIPLTANGKLKRFKFEQ